MSASVASSSSSKQQQRKEEDKEKKKKKSWSAFDDGAETQVTVRDSEGGGKEGVMSRKEKRRERRLANEPRSVSGEGLRGIHVIDFMEARATELSNMLKAVQSKGGWSHKFHFETPEKLSIMILLFVSVFCLCFFVLCCAQVQSACSRGSPAT